MLREKNSKCPRYILIQPRLFELTEAIEAGMSETRKVLQRASPVGVAKTQLPEIQMLATRAGEDQEQRVPDVPLTPMRDPLEQQVQRIEAVQQERRDHSWLHQKLERHCSLSEAQRV